MTSIEAQMQQRRSFIGDQMAEGYLPPPRVS